MTVQTVDDRVLEITEAVSDAARKHIWYVLSDSGAKYIVMFVRGNHKKRWMCQCTKFFLHCFKKNVHCHHIKAVRQATGR